MFSVSLADVDTTDTCLLNPAPSGVHKGVLSDLMTQSLCGVAAL